MTKNRKSFSVKIKYNEHADHSIYAEKLLVVVEDWKNWTGKQKVISRDVAVSSI